MNKTTVRTKHHETFDIMKKDFNYTSIMQAPRISKIVVSTGIGSIKDKKRIEFIGGRLTRITGQTPATRASKKSVATFKIREGDPAGFQITLRGSRCQSFFDKLIHIVLPRVKDFRGIKPSNIDEMGNITIGLKEHTVFPETSDEDAKDTFGLAITINTTAKNKKEAEAFLRHVGVPLKEEK